MAKLTLDSNFHVDMEVYNFTLKYENKSFDDSKKKEVTAKNEWHFPRLSNALDKYMNECLKPATEIQQLLGELKRIELLISEIK